ncbi:predicted protein [Nematostella vectensis]|uniref:G-protein coupled receptors family 1 profile domain-containing protein n=1 Tax=Nematostella vectensis TaxID=45351 RepID=A7RQE1_NEMVE|nr:predicted protein [Nematostella vectensis]|eukprot:XP_001638410.1 predicted protein [Nematostella vectensis]
MLANNTTWNGSFPSRDLYGVGRGAPNVEFTLIMLSLIILVGLVGNSLVVAVVVCISHMRTTTNFLLLNVAASDIVTLLLTLLHVGVAAAAITSKKTPSGSLWCKLIQPNTLANVALLATGLTLMVLSVERYNALVKPMRLSRRLTRSNVHYVIAGIWLVSMVMALPMLVYLDKDPVTGQCSPGEKMQELYISLTVIVVFMTIAPFLVIAFSYFQIIYGLYFNNTICSTHAPGLQREDILAKRKLVKLLITVTVAFFVAFVPYGVTTILRFNLSAVHNAKQLANIRQLTKVMAYLIPIHSSINPFLYAFQSRNYKEGFKNVVSKLIKWRKETNNNYQSSFRSGRYSTQVSTSTTL